MKRALLWAALLAGLPTAVSAAEPRPEDGIPRIERTSAQQTQRDWMAVKGIAGPAAQVEAIAKKRLRRSACDDLVDIRALVEAGGIKGFGFRDNVRGRSWARPSMALLLIETMKRFQVDHPGRVVVIGDVSQPGCGQLEHGVLVHELAGDAARRLIEAARIELGEPALVEVRRAKDFPWESDRFGPPDERVLVTTRLLAKDGSGEGLRLRVAKARHRELPAATPEESKAFEVGLAKLWGGKRIASREVVSEDAAGVKSELWLTHVVQPEARQQAVVITRKKPGKRLDFAEVIEVRIAEWDDKKPGSFPDEVRWVVASVTPAPIPPKKKVAPPTPASAATFTRWALMYEAGHISHLSGVDADLSYVTVGDTKHFAVDFDVMDVPATLSWLTLLEETGRELGTPIDSILVAPTVKRHLEKSLPKSGAGALAAMKKARMWRLLTLVGGHDAHHHLRITEASASKEADAKKKLAAFAH